MAETGGPRFSIVVPAYQAAATLPETLDAIRGQIYTDWECLVVDDGSTDDTLRIASTYAALDPRIRPLHQDNQGTARAYNTGVSAAQGDFIVICSADDVLLPEHLTSFSAFLDREPGYDIYSANGYYWRAGDERDLVYIEVGAERVHSKTLADVIRVCFYSVGAVFRRELFSKAGGFRPGVFGEDYDFWLRAMALGARHRYLPEPLSLFRISAAQKSSRLETMYRSDIRIVSDLAQDFILTPGELRAVEDSIRERERLIRGLHGTTMGRLRIVAERLAVAVLGRPRARRLWHSLKSRWPVRPAS